MKSLILAACLSVCLSASLAATASAATAYDCAPFEPARLDASPDPRAAELRALGRLADAGALEPRRVSRELAAWVRREPSRYTDVQRVAIQSRLFRLARRSPSTAHRAAAAIAMRRVALSPARAARLESRAPFGLESVLGSRARWIERATDSCGSGPLIHERVAGGGLAFHPIRSGATHALVSQMVHVDTAGFPRITGVIEKVELRVGRDRRATACVLGIDDASLALAVLRLEPRPVAELPPTLFFRRSGDQLDCVRCHPDDRAQGARDLLDPVERERIIGARERLLVSFAARQWRRLQEN